MTERYMEVLIKDISTPRITCNPNTGRVTIKFPLLFDVMDPKIAKLARQVYDFDFPPKTFRGKVDIHNGKYFIQMYNDSKSISYTFKVE